MFVCLCLLCQRAISSKPEEYRLTRPESGRVVSRPGKEPLTVETRFQRHSHDVSRPL